MFRFQPASRAPSRCARSARRTITFQSTGGGARRELLTNSDIAPQGLKIGSANALRQRRVLRS